MSVRKRQNDKEKRRTTKKIPKLKRIRIRLECFFSYFFIILSSHLLYLNWSVSLHSLVWTFQFSAYFMSSFSIINHCECVWFFFSIRMRLLLLPHLLTVIFLRQTNIPVKNEISSLEIHWQACRDGRMCAHTHAHVLIREHTFLYTPFI